MNRAGLEPGERTEFLLRSAEAGERLGGPGSEDLPGLGQATARTRSCDEPLAGCSLEEAQMLARTRLADADLCGSGGHALLTADLDEEAHPRGVPELPEGARCRHTRYR